VNKWHSYAGIVFRRAKLTQCEVKIMEEKKGFWSCLFDLSFTEFITTRVIKILYMLGIGIAAIVGLMLVVTAFTKGFAAGLLHVIAAPIVFILIVIVLRIYMELVLTLFRIEANTQKQAPAAQAPAPAPPQEPETTE